MVSDMWLASECQLGSGSKGLEIGGSGGSASEASIERGGEAHPEGLFKSTLAPWEMGDPALV